MNLCERLARCEPVRVEGTEANEGSEEEVGRAGDRRSAAWGHAACQGSFASGDGCRLQAQALTGRVVRQPARELVESLKRVNELNGGGIKG